jgi:hypothetical protein
VNRRERFFRRKEGRREETNKGARKRDTLMMRIELWDRRIQTCESLCRLPIPDFLLLRYPSSLIAYTILPVLSPPCVLP